MPASDPNEIGYALLAWASAHAQGWAPQRNVEIVVGFVAGGGMDRTARTLDRILVANKLLNAPVNVVNKPGGSSNIAYTYVSQRRVLTDACILPRVSTPTVAYQWEGP